MQVHVALSSREVEVEYLEDLTDRILPLVNKVGMQCYLHSLNIPFFVTFCYNHHGLDQA